MEVSFDQKAWFVFVASVILVYTTISLGAVTRAMEAGVGRGTEWPLCLGHIVPPSSLKELEVFLEYSHRVTAFLAFSAVLLSFLLAFPR
jgi:cytochrome c oxidase assembly protein subunit 15